MNKRRVGSGEVWWGEAPDEPLPRRFAVRRPARGYRSSPRLRPDRLLAPPKAETIFLPPFGLTPHRESLNPKFMERDKWFGRMAGIRWLGSLFLSDKILEPTPMRTLLIWEALILAASVHVSAADFYEVTHSKGEPKYLVPVRMSEHEQWIAKYLFVTDGDLGRMVEMPSFEPESCISVHANIPKSLIEKYGPDRLFLVPDEEKTYVMTLTTVLTSFSNSRASNDGLTNEVRVSRIDRPISLDLAVAIQRVWGKALRLTCYAPNYPGGYDGVTYQFSVWVKGAGVLEGETWTPQSGLPRELVDVGRKLIAFVRQDAKGKEMTEQELIKKLKKLESKIPKA
jgi:hypothetical protein